MFRILVPAVAALGLVAFAAQSRTSAPDPVAAAEVPVMGWSVHHEGALAKLAYGVANSDQLALMITCMPGDVRAAVYGDVQVAGARVTQASLSVDPLSAGEAEESLIPVNDPALLALGAHGRLTVVGEAGQFELSATAQERRDVSQFLAYCSAGRT